MRWLIKSRRGPRHDTRTPSQPGKSHQSCAYCWCRRVTSPWRLETRPHGLQGTPRGSRVKLFLLWFGRSQRGSSWGLGTFAVEHWRIHGTLNLGLAYPKLTILGFRLISIWTRALSNSPIVSTPVTLLIYGTQRQGFQTAHGSPRSPRTKRSVTRTWNLSSCRI